MPRAAGLPLGFACALVALGGWLPADDVPMGFVTIVVGGEVCGVCQPSVSEVKP